MGDLLLRRRAMMGKPYTSVVEYLLSSDTQWIDTGVIPNQDIVIGVKWKNESPQMNKYLFGGGETIMDSIRAYIGNSSYWRFGDGALKFDTEDSSMRIAQMDKTKIVINGEEFYYENVVTPFSSPTTIKLFSGGQYNAPISTRVYYFKISENGTLILDFIPVRVGTVGYMYDRVSGRLFGNLGTGDFVVGPDIQ